MSKNNTITSQPECEGTILIKAVCKHLQRKKLNTYGPEGAAYLLGLRTALAVLEGKPAPSFKRQDVWLKDKLSSRPSIFNFPEMVSVGWLDHKIDLGVFLPKLDFDIPGHKDTA